MAGKSPMPNHRIARGIHEIGEIVLKTCIKGENVFPVLLYQPKTIPMGIAQKAASKNPENTLIRLATTLFNSNPVVASSIIALPTTIGPGKRSG